uniref:ZAD domain-containing protein n=1 Tax=Anopheles christyi TaxID=43041 RepID=A0A182JNR0_9DIPT
MENVFNFEVCFEEELPQNICKQCSWNVQDFQCFSEIVEKNQDKLKQKYASSMKLNCTGDGSMEKMDHDSCDKKKLSKESSNK